MKNEVDGINYLNVSCDEIFKLVTWKDAKVLASLLILAVINIAVIVGNVLVILAVFISSKLRTVTNFFIVSLAVADLMVGIAVLPFSAVWEIFEIWIFGEVFCSMWLAIDVWMCTASILNLCAISLDRYVAVSRPFTYPRIMSSRKAKILIAVVWILSFLICFPPLVGWNDRKRTYYRHLANTTSFSSDINGTEGSSNWFSSSSPEPLYYEEECTYTCELTNDKGYVLYSAIGSFFLPMFVMLFFYWRIYRAAVETTRAINQGFRTTKGARLLGTRFDDQRLTLRIHRGRSVQNYHGSPSSQKSSPSNMERRQGTVRIPRSRSHERLKAHLTPPPRGKRSASYRAKPSPHLLSTTSSGPSSSGSFSNGLRAGYSGREGAGGNLREKKYIQGESSLGDGKNNGRLRRESESDSNSSPSPTLGGACNKKYETHSSSSAEERKPKLVSKMGKRNIKAQVKRFRSETKAAKTCLIIVGGFIGCWLPFFTVYVIRAFCFNCIPPLLFSVLFWLGYCNSALNPLIVGLQVRQFRETFRKILCRCICKREKDSQLQDIPIYLSSLGEDSEGNKETEKEVSDV